jgi:hypothetical protein
MITKNLPRGIRLLYDPHLSHERLAAREHGAKSTREIDEDARTAADLMHLPSAERQRLRGNWSDGSANREIARILEVHGFLVDETEDAPPDQIIYETNAGLVFRGVAPSSALGGATVVGTGASRTLNDATDNSGRITLTTGTGVSTTGTILTFTFDVPKTNADYGVYFWPADSDASSTAGRSVYSDFGSRTTTQWVLANTTTLASSTSYHWDYLIVERRSL